MAKIRRLAPAHPADQTRLEYLRGELFAMQGTIAEAEEAGSWQAAVNGRRLALQIRADIDALEAEEAANADIATVDDIVTEVLKMPDNVFAHPAIRSRVEDCS